ncbi:hypothetical protein E4T42_04725 [Aureobasidium subglaciale]|nr:hypothetical protein E4T42_04725 [Aureobasidium subglaciale]
MAEGEDQSPMRKKTRGDAPLDSQDTPPTGVKREYSSMNDEEARVAPTIPGDPGQIAPLASSEPARHLDPLQAAFAEPPGDVGVPPTPDHNAPRMAQPEPQRPAFVAVPSSNLIIHQAQSHLGYRWVPQAQARGWDPDRNIHVTITNMNPTANFATYTARSSRSMNGLLHHFSAVVDDLQLEVTSLNMTTSTFFAVIWTPASWERLELSIRFFIS